MQVEPAHSFAATGSHFLPCALDRVQDARMRAASAQVFIERRRELFARGLMVAFDQLGGLHDDSRQAIAALPRLAVDDRALKGMHPAGGCEPFDGRDRPAFDRPYRKLAGSLRASVDQNGACAALSSTASEPDSLQPQIVAQDVQERSVVVIDGDAMGLAVDQ